MHTSTLPRLWVIRLIPRVILQSSRPTCNPLHILCQLCPKSRTTHTRTRIVHKPSSLTIRSPSMATIPHRTPSSLLLAIDSKTGHPPATGICRKCSVGIAAGYCALHSPTMGSSSLLVHGTAHSECGTSRPARPFLTHGTATLAGFAVSHSLRMTDVLSLALMIVRSASGMYRKVNSCSSLQSIRTLSAPLHSHLMAAKSSRGTSKMRS